VEFLQKKMKIIIISLLISYISGSSSCHFTHGGKNYDMSGLESKAPFTSSDQLFSLGLCSKGGKDCSIASKKTFVSQFLQPSQSSSSCISVLAYWDTDSGYTVGGLTGADANKDGFSLKFSNGQYCDLIGRQRELTANFVCDPNTEVGSYEVAESPVCIYSLTMRTKHACEAHSSSSGGEDDSGLSGGWVFIIILIVCTFVYCVGGIVYNCKFNDQAGDEIKEMVPQREFWCEKLPSWTYTGCVVSWQWCQSQYHERYGGDGMKELGEA